MNVNQYKLEGLCCANCAGKIEQRMSEVPGFKDVSLNFATQTLSFKAEQEDYVEFIQGEVDVIEQGVTVVHKYKHIHHHVEETIQDHEPPDIGVSGLWLKIGVGVAFFTMAIFLPLTDLYRLSLFLTAYIIIGGDVLLSAVRNIRNGHLFDENFLMSIATIGAFAIGEYPEGVAVMLFYQIGELFQDMAVKRSRQNISDLMDIRPDVAWLKSGDDTRQVAAASVTIDDVIVIKPGERVPLDGIVINGTTMLDTSALTGESLPRKVTVGDDILSGTMNQTGLVEVAVKKTFADSTVSKILDLVENAAGKKAETEKFITKFARYYTPVVVCLALALALFPPLLFGGTFAEWLNRSLIFLVVSCPCALVISIPLGYFGGIGGASKQGILIKGSNYLEGLNHVNTIVFDKTGTLTKGVFKVTEVHAVGMGETELLSYAAAVESQSNHPIAKSILAAFEGRPMEVMGMEEVAGQGLRGKVNGKEVLIGNEKLMAQAKIPHESPVTGSTVVHVSIDSKYAGYISIADEIKEDSASSVKALKEAGVNEVYMLTGDRNEVAMQVAKTIGIDKVYGELLPHEKVERLEEILDNNSTGKTIFVGDGINDAPVLARADIGVAMGGIGSDAAIEAADVVLMTDEPSKLADGLIVARRTNGIVWQNIIFALGVKGLVLILGALGMATMWAAVFADVGVAILAILNATRIIRNPLGTPVSDA